MTATWWDDQNHADQKEWPDKRVNGWAPGNYTCTCADCGVRYLGDKRSVQCFPCASKKTKTEPDLTTGRPDLVMWSSAKDDPWVSRNFRKATLWLSTVAIHAEMHSKDPRTRVGAAILTPDWGIVSMGYNGFPMGTPDDPAIWNDREQKYKHVIHAESNAIDFAHRNLKGMMLVCNLFPCHLCAQRIAQNGIKTLWFSADPRPDLEAEIAMKILRNAKVDILQVRGVARVTNAPTFGKAEWDR